jgi:tetratricopeptide (TPR) repeat protein
LWNCSWAAWKGHRRDRQRYLELSEKYYLYALERRGDYQDALYGLSVLYLYELEDPVSAEPIIRDLRSFHPNFIEADFLLAAAFVLQGKFSDAEEVYEDI